MNEKRTITISFGTAICIVIIILLLIALIGMSFYIYYNGQTNFDNTTYTQNTSKDLNNTENISSNIELLDTNSKLVNQLYDYILKFNYYDETLVYQANKVTYTDIDNQLKLLTAFQNLDESQAEKVKTTDYTGVVEDDGNSYKYLYTKETVEQKVKEIFGKNATVIHENCSPYDGYNRLYEDGIYTCYEYAGGGDVPWSNSKNQIIKAETNGNNIYLYDTYVHIVENSTMNDIESSGLYYDIYATSDRNILIEEKVNLEEEGIYEGWNDDVPFEEFEETYMKNLFNIIKNKQKTFKHTFSKDSTGNYYWVSTELVD